MGSPPDELLTSTAAARIDRAQIEAGTPGIELMERAGRGITREITRRYRQGPTLVLCGPGNNGGDGYVVARRLAAAGWQVTAATFTAWSRPGGDAAIALERWAGPVEDLASLDLGRFSLAIDAVFGAGLARDIGDDVAGVFRRLEQDGIPIVAVDLPSGIDGTTGARLGDPPRAECSVTFSRLKRGHVLQPGRDHCGDVVCVDIGIDDELVELHGPHARLNGPDLWRADIPASNSLANKFDHGHVALLGGPATMTGASIIAARAAWAAGAGLVTILCDEQAQGIYAAHLVEIMTRVIHSGEELTAFLCDRRVSTLVAGPGMGLEGNRTELLEAALRCDIPMVLDADAISLIAAHRERLAPLLSDRCVLTPHEGEFNRLFPDLGGDKVERAAAAASRLGCSLLIKGSDTAIASQKGEVAINATAPASLARAGSGDRLAGMIGGLLALGMPAWPAATCGVWLHGLDGAPSGHSATRSEAPWTFEIERLRAALAHHR